MNVPTMDELPPDPVVSVILCTYAPEMYEHFTEAAESVLNQSYDRIELVIVVDGSDEMLNRITADFGDQDGVVVHGNEANVGLLESRNTGAELATGDIVAFIDDDAVADEQWIEELVAAYRANNPYAVGGKMVPEWMAGKPDFLPEEFYWLVGVTHKGFADGPGEVRNTFGSNISFRREVFLELGGFDSSIGGRQGEKNLQGGETELCARMRTEYGRGVYYLPEAEVAHKVFAYRTRFWWLLDRAFWQGYSKRAMESIVGDSGGEEDEYLKRLVIEFVPERLKGLLTGPSAPAIKQLGTLLLFAGTVGLGYLYGATKW